MSPREFQQRERVRKWKETFLIAFGIFCFGIFIGSVVVLSMALSSVVRL